MMNNDEMTDYNAGWEQMRDECLKVIQEARENWSEPYNPIVVGTLDAIAFMIRCK